ncbi:C40 family peptidase [Embleya hyalina]|uniref:Glycoside hydrolase n=1 Tax=Embleya hyalina TaxID=516124 RepID=A0A401YRK5_9ACTN|nr:C40 family peptidase [Embleya hyalina]GCD97240.1 glycoside hydrolase [Embleya hyalina]
MPRRSFFRTAVPAGLAAVLVLTLTPGALADDPGGAGYPDADQVRRAHDAVAGKVDDIDRIEAELDREADDLARLDIRADAAVEEYNGAVVLRRQARDRAADADVYLRTADARLSRARDELGRLAAQTYRMGGGAGLGAFRAMLGADSPGDLVSRMESLRRISQDGDDTLRRGIAAVHDAAVAKTDAEHGAEAAARATEAVRAAKDRVEAELAAQRSRVHEITARHTALLAESATLRRTSIDLETRRRDGRAAEAQRRAEEEARARAEADADREQARREKEEADRRAEQARPADAAGEQAAARPAKPDTTAKPAERVDPAAASRPDRSGGRAAAGPAAAIAYAKAQLGKPYVWGGEGPSGFDCSGLVMQAWRRAGVRMAHFAATQYFESTPVSYRNLRPGDLVFWTETKSASDIHHVAMYLGGGRMIHAPRTGDVVKIGNLFSMGTPDYYARPS